MHATSRRSWIGPLAAGAAMLFAGAVIGQPAASQPGHTQPAAQPKATVPAKIGEPVADFTLPDTDGKEHTLSALLADGKIVVLEWFNPDCPVSAGFHTRRNIMVETAEKYKDRGVVWLAVNSGAPGKQGAGKERNTKAKEDFKMPYPILLDESGTAGRAFGAKTTPHMFIITPDRKLAYKGDIVDQEDKTVNLVDQALTQILNHETVTRPETESHGCSVKYGPEPKKTN